MASARTIRSCLATLGITTEAFAGCVNAAEEFSAIKKLYFKQVLTTHPDKGGDAAAFRALQEAWESLRVLFDSGKTHASGFAHYFSTAGGKEQASARAAPGPSPSWEWYAEAAAEPVPPYRCEAAKSGRSQCKATGAACKHGPTDEEKFIPAGATRFGSMDEEAGAYGRWHHLPCWRCPAAVWLALPDPDTCDDPAAFEAAVIAMQQLVLCGYTELDKEQRAAVIAHLMDKSNWAKRTKKSKTPMAAAGAGAGAGEAGAGGAGSARGAVAAAGAPSSALATLGGAGSVFLPPRPGTNGALANALVAKTFVLTGIFPELGGGTGLDLGKERCKAMIAAFGGRITSAVSGKTSYLVVGKEPGASKVMQARAKGVPCIDIAGLKAVLEGGAGASLDEAPEAVIGDFSKGYKNNAVKPQLTGGAAPLAALKAPKAARKVKAEAPAGADDAPPAKKAKTAAKGKAKKAESEDEDEDGEEEADEEADWAPKPKKTAAKRGAKRA